MLLNFVLSVLRIKIIYFSIRRKLTLQNSFHYRKFHKWHTKHTRYESDDNWLQIKSDFPQEQNLNTRQMGLCRGKVYTNIYLYVHNPYTWVDLWLRASVCVWLWESYFLFLDESLLSHVEALLSCIEISVLDIELCSGLFSLFRAELERVRDLSLVSLSHCLHLNKF